MGKSNVLVGGFENVSGLFFLVNLFMQRLEEAETVVCLEWHTPSGIPRLPDSLLV